MHQELFVQGHLEAKCKLLIENSWFGSMMWFTYSNWIHLCVWIIDSGAEEM